MKYDKAEAKNLILARWRTLPAGERTAEDVSAFAMQATKDYPFDSAGAHGVIRLWLMEELG